MSEDRNARKARLAQLGSKRGKRQHVDDQLYDEVDDRDYSAVYDDENFVEDDDQGGYIDNGLNEEEQQFSDEYDNTDSKLPNKRKRKAEVKVKEKPEPPSKNIAAMFSSSVKTRRIKQEKSKTSDDEKFLDEILASVDGDQTTAKKTVQPRNYGFSHRPRSSLAYGSGLGSGYVVRGGSARNSYASQQSSFSAASESSSTLNGSSKLKSENKVSFSVPSDEAMDTSDDIRVKQEEITNDDEYFDDIDADALMAMDELDQQQVKTEVKEATVESLQVPNAETAHQKMLKLKEERPDLQNWETAAALVTDNVPAQTTEEVKPVVSENEMNALEEDGSLHLWWYDAFERREKGTVYLFGKILNKDTNRYVSCCVGVNNIKRVVFALPRKHRLDEQGNPSSEEVTMRDVYTEVTELGTRLGMHRVACRPVTRKYAFELPDVPVESEYIEAHSSYQDPEFPENTNGATFSRMFGTKTGPLEHLLIGQDIMGPCWLKIEKATFENNQITWCKAEYTVDNPKNVTPLRDASGNAPSHTPPLVVLSLSLRTIMNHQKNQNEIVAASGLVCSEVKIDEPTPIDAQPKTRFSVVRQLAETPYPAGFNALLTAERKLGLAIQPDKTEVSLLNCLLARIHIADPDVIVGHNFAGFDLDVMLHRMKHLGVQHWHKLGRFKRQSWPVLQTGAGGAGEATYQERTFMAGRLVCDTYLAAKDLIKSKSYRLTDLAQSQLKIAREDLEYDKTHEFFNDQHKLIHLIKHCAFDCFLTASLMFKLQILPLTKQLTNLAGNLWSRTLTGARAERNEYLLLHEFHRQSYICPDKQMYKKVPVEQMDIDFDPEEANEQLQKPQFKKGRKKPAYSGGLVLEPKKGFYDKYVLLLDFNSLYPSIMQEYNVCFTTIQRHNLNQSEEDAEEKVPDVPDRSVEQGVLPQLIKTLVDRRRQVKNLMKDPANTEAEYMQYNIRQQALKLTANSMYGCLGFIHSRFYAKPLAMLITHKGREILQNTVDLAGGLDLNVIYGDTDSIMVYTNETEISKVKEMGYMLKKKVNERYNLLEIDIDGFFKHLLLLKKKKYAALLVEEKPDGTLSESVETKGLDLVRRDWCDLSHDVSSRVLSFILSDKEREEVVNEIHTYLEQVGKEIREHEVPLEKFVINKQLTKNPQEYADAKVQPHVQVALRMRQAGISVKSGDTIPYVVCLVDNIPGGSSAGFAERAFHPDDVIRDKMQLDIDWYLNQQVHPPVGRLCSPIDGTDIARLAQCLGLDSTKFNVGRTYAEDNDEFTTLESQINDTERFKNADRLVIRCPDCRYEQEFDGITRLISDTEVVPGLQCNRCKRLIKESVARGALIRAIRSYIQKYYEGWLVCDDSTCNSRTRSMSVYGKRCLQAGCHGKVNREYTDKQLYTQLLYFATILDPVKAKQIAASAAFSGSVESIINEQHMMFTRLNAVADGYLRRSGYRHVDLSKLMSLVKI